MTDLFDLSRMIHPWWGGSDPGGRGFYGDHIYPDCEALVHQGEPREGVGWLDPYGGSVCVECFRRFDPADCAKRWAVAREH